MEGSTPYKWPYDEDLRPSNTALIVIDMQVDFCGKGGYVDLMGYDLGLTTAPVEPIRRVLEACRAAGFTVIHTREGHRPDLADLPANKQWRSKQIGAGIGEVSPSGSRLLVRGEPGWEIISELAPADGEIVIDKPGKGSFCATDLDLILRLGGIRNVILTGVTTDVCVHTTMREANDRGYECLLLADCTAATDPANHQAAINMIRMQGGVFGAVADSEALLKAFKNLPSMTKPISIMQQKQNPKTPATVQASNDRATNGFHEPTTTPSGEADRVLKVPAKPYPYTLPISRTALIMIDFQKDFMCEGGFGAALGNDVTLLRSCLPAAANLLAACRTAAMPIIHTMEAHKPDLSDLPPAKLNRGCLPEGLRIGDKGHMGRILVRGEPGNGIVDEMAPLEGEKLLYKPGKGSFYATNLEPWLRSYGITHLIITGVTTEVCVQTTMREANDRGFDCLLVSDATASYSSAFKQATLEMVVAQGGIVGWVADSDAVISALQA